MYKKENNRPIHNFRSGKFRAAVWKNVSKKSGEEFLTVSLQKSQRDGMSGEYINVRVGNFFMNELSELIDVLVSANDTVQKSYLDKEVVE